MKSIIVIAVLLAGCTEQTVVVTTDSIVNTDSVKADSAFIDSPEKPGLFPPDAVTYTALDGNPVSADSLLTFAQTLLGTPYLYASMDPRKGFDCSGFINYVFNHFKISVPRSSRDFENFGTTVPLTEAKKGNLILFTGTDNTIRIIGHIGIVISTDGVIKFIHSTSGKAYGVTVSELDKYYQSRFMRIARVPQVQ